MIIIVLFLILLLIPLYPLPALAEDKPAEPPKIEKQIKNLAPRPSAQPQGLLPIKDTYVNSHYPEINFGDQETWSTGFTSSTKIAFLQFELDEKIKQGLKEGQEAILNLWLDQSYGELEPVEMELLLPYADWQEDQLNWNNKPSLYSSGLKVVLEATPGAQKINLTPLLEKWLSGEMKNMGFAFYYNLDTFSRTFFSKENEKHPPSLVLEKKKAEEDEQLANLEKGLKFKLPQVLQAQTSVKGTQPQKTLKDYLNQNTILPLATIWTGCIVGLLYKVFKEFPLA
jgi:hypothetical protein